MESISMASVIAPQEITANKIVSYVRALNNSRGSNIVTLHKLINNKVEALEFIAKEDKDLINIPLKDLKLKENTLIAAIIRDGRVIYPSGMDVIEPNDSVIIVTTNQFLDDLNDILE
jgi:trk system potassium uptake protein TrkA